MIRICPLLLLYLLSKVLASPGIAEGANPQDFFRHTADHSGRLPADRVYPQGRLFGFSLYSVGGGAYPIGPAGEQLPATVLKDQRIAAALRRVKKDGFTMIGPQYELDYRILKDAESLGLQCIYTIGSDFKGNSWTDFVENRNVEVDLKEVEAKAQKQVAAVASHRSIAWWNVVPEEMRYWRKNEMEYLDALTRGIRSADPLRRPIMMYEPNNRDANALAETLKFLDLTSRGLYANYAGLRDARGPFIHWSIEQEIEAARLANRPDAVALAVPEMFQQPAPEFMTKAGTWARHDTYLSLICGVKGVVVFSMREREGFTAHEDYYEGFASVARELNGKKKLGQVFLFGEKRNDLRLTARGGSETVTLPDTFGANLGKPVSYPSITWLEVAYRNARYLFAVNSASQPVRVMVEGLPEGSITMRDLFGGRTTETPHGEFETSFEPLEVKGWEIKLATHRR